MVKELFNILKENNLTIASAESITGGRFSSLIVEEAGASEFLKGAFICYTNEYKYDVLGVSKDIEIVSEQMAIELAESARIKADSSIAISFTGNSSPNGIEGKQQGLTWIAITNGNKTETFEYVSEANTRKEIIEDTAINGIKIILNFLGQTY